MVSTEFILTRLNSGATLGFPSAELVGDGNNFGSRIPFCYSNTMTAYAILVTITPYITVPSSSILDLKNGPAT